MLRSRILGVEPSSRSVNDMNCVEIHVEPREAGNTQAMRYKSTSDFQQCIFEFNHSCRICHPLMIPRPAVNMYGRSPDTVMMLDFIQPESFKSDAERYEAKEAAKRVLLRLETPFELYMGSLVSKSSFDSRSANRPGSWYLDEMGSVAQGERRNSPEPS